MITIVARSAEAYPKKKYLRTTEGKLKTASAAVNKSANNKNPERDIVRLRYSLYAISFLLTADILSIKP